MAEALHRPSPEELLAVVQAEEQRKKRGRFKIFLGYCVGVGKTYAMLEAARQRQREGVDVVVGWVDTHDRPETEALLEGLEVIPHKTVLHREIQLDEMDLDAVLTRKPQLALVDELAHSNVPGSRHRKRWQDIEELLKAGIDVYTTLNIQHLESLNDVVTQITRVRVRETIPDRVLDEADDIKLVDLTPDELLERLKAGKVYMPTQTRYAVANFFGPGKLAALRELVMRRAADRVDSEMRAHMQLNAVAGPWPATDRLLVCLGPGAQSEQLVRATKRLATQLKARWDALFVESPSQRLEEADRARVEAGLNLAESLGARIVRLSGQQVVPVALEYARGQNVTKIVIGRSSRSPGWFSRHLSDLLIEGSGDIDVLVISHEDVAPVPEGRRHLDLMEGLWGYVLALGMVTGVTAVGEVVEDVLAPTNLVMFYLLGVVVTALRGGRAPAGLCAALSVLAFDFFFVPPRYTFQISQTEYFVTFTALLLVGLVVGDLTSRVKEQVLASRRSQLHVMAAFALSRDLAQAADTAQIVTALTRHIKGPLASQASVFLPEAEHLRIHPASSLPVASNEEIAVAEWVYKNGRAAGCGTDTLPALPDHYYPLRQGEQTLAVLRLSLDGRRLGTDQQQLVETLANLAAMAIQRVRLAEEARRTLLLEETERLQSTLLNSISHDLQTPITSIVGCLDGLIDPVTQTDIQARATLVQSAREQTERLRGLVDNLLDMTRVEAGQTGLKKEPCDLSDLLGSALGRLEDAYRDRKVELDIPPDFPLIPVDFVPFSQVLYNLLENAAKYSPPGTPVEVAGRVVDKLTRRVQVRVSDHGPGIPEAARERIFDKFYRLSDRVPGTGLGLAIVRGLVELHGGSIWVEERAGGGSTFVIQIPLEEANS